MLTPRRIVTGAFLLMSWSSPAPALDQAADRRALEQDMATQFASAIAQERRIADERERRLLENLDSRDHSLRIRLRAIKATRQQLDEARIQLSAVVNERERLTSEIAKRDREYAAEVAEYRRQIAGLVETTDPELTTALQRYADGDRQGGFSLIERIIRAENRAEDAAAAIRKAARIRQVATLALDMKDRGEKTTAEVLPLWQEAQREDGDYHWGWIVLGGLYEEAGRLKDAQAAAESGLAVAVNDQERALSSVELGDTLVAEGNLADARARYEQSLKLNEALMAANPASAEANRDVGLSLQRLGSVLVAEGDLAGARARYEQSLRVGEALMEALPTNAVAKRDVSVALARLGDVLVWAGDFVGAQARYQQCMKLHEELLAANPGSADAKRDLSVSLDKLGDALVTAGDLPGAWKRYGQSLKLREALIGANPTSAQAKRDMTISLNKLGDVLVTVGDLPGAKARYEQSLKLSEGLWAANPTSAEAKRDVSQALESLGDVLLASGDLAGAQTRQQRSLELRDTLMAANPTSAEAKRDVSVSLNKLGDVLAAARDVAGARARYEQSLKLREELMAANPASAEAKRDVGVTLWNLAHLPGGDTRWKELMQLLAEMERRGVLRPADRRVLEAVRAQVVDIDARSRQVAAPASPQPSPKTTH